MPFRLNELAIDLRDAWKLREGWTTLAKYDLQNNYRRTTFGPFWITIQQLIWILSINFVFTNLLGKSTSEFLPIAAIGIVLWSLISNLIIGSANTYTYKSTQIKSSTIPLPFYIFESIFLTILNFLHTIVALLFLPLVAHVSISPIALLSTSFILGSLLVNGLFFSLWIAPLSARYRDVATTMPIILQIFFFITPVFWSSELVKGRINLINLNPLAWFIETFRGPFLDQSLHTRFIIGISLLTIANAVIAFIVYPLTKKKVSLWV